ncbi:hypothetical protein TcG_13450, partial [Trypanosoma cruzi]
GQRHGDENLTAQRTHEDTRSSNVIHVASQQRASRTTHTRPQREAQGASSYTAQPFSSLRPDKLTSRLTVRHGAHHPPNSKCNQQVAAQSPSCHCNGEQKQSSSRTINAS